MLKKVFFLSVIISFSAAVCVGQSLDPKVHIAQNVLRKNLVKDAPQVYEVRFENCTASIKTEKSMPYSMPSESSGNIAIARSGFPHDEASGHLSAGPGDSSGMSIVKEKIVIDFAKNDSPTIVGSYSGLSRFGGIQIRSAAGSDSISVSRRGESQDIPMIVFLVKKKAADKTAKAFQDVIDRCVSEKH